MDRKSFESVSVLLLTIALMSGCASTATVSTAPGAIDAQEVLEIVVLNETPGPMNVFAYWGSGRKVRLGRLTGGANATYHTPVLGTDVVVEFELLENPRKIPEAYFLVRSDEGIELQVRRVFPRYEVLQRRFSREPAGVPENDGLDSGRAT